MPRKIEEWHWEITRSCNLLCKHCLTSCGKPNPRELKKPEAIAAVHKIRSLGCKRVMITGGEPFCREDLPEILEELRLNRIKASVLTNGISPFSKIIKTVLDSVSHLGVSLDGSCQQTNDFIRGSGSFKRTLRTIRSFVSVLPVYLYCTLSRVNLDDLTKVVELGNSLGVEGIHFSEITLRGRAYPNRSKFSLNREQKVKLAEIASTLTGMTSPATRCCADLSALYMLSDGSVYPCTELAFIPPVFKIGRITDEDFSTRLAQIEKKLACSVQPACCYSLYSGNGLVFLVNNVDQPSCPMASKGRRYL